MEKVEEAKKYATAEEILATNDIEFAEVAVPEWKTTIILRMLNGEEAIRFIDDIAKDKSSAAVRILILSAVGPDKKTPLFTPAHIERLKQKSLKALLRLQKVALEVNGFNDEGGLAQAKNA